jgi:diadenylate cyclase
VLGLVVVFQPEIRRAIVQLGDSSIFRPSLPPRRQVDDPPAARRRQPQQGPRRRLDRDRARRRLAEFAEIGTTLDAELTSDLIKSIFFPNSALHDGGVIVRDDRIVAASCLFPLSQDPGLDRASARGTAPRWACPRRPTRSSWSSARRRARARRRAAAR